MVEFQRALRRLLRRPGYSFFVIATIMVGIGATSAAFTVADALVFQPAPFQDADRLVIFGSRAEQSEEPIDGISFSDFEDVRRSVSRLEEIAAFTSVHGFNLVGEDGSERVDGSLVTANFFRLLGIEAEEGRLFNPGEDAQPGAPPHVVLSHGFWTRRWGGDPAAIGTTLHLDTNAFVIVGVLPESFRDFIPDSRPDIYLLTSMAASLYHPGYLEEGSRGFRWLTGVARMAPGANETSVRSELSTLASDLATRYPDSNAGVGAALVPLTDYAFGYRDFGRTTLVLLIGGACVLLIGCVNIANLLLVRAHDQRSETAIRQALGASATQTMAPMLAESFVLTALGGVAGLGLGWVLTRVLVSTSPLPVPDYVDVSLDGRAVLFTLFVLAVTTLALALVPALRSLRIDLRSALYEGSRRVSGGRSRTGPVLVIAEVALTLVLLIAAGLLIRSALNFNNIDYGFRTDNVLSMRLELPEQRYRPDPEAVRSVYRQLQETAAAIPGAQSAHVWGPGMIGDSEWYRDVVPEGRSGDRQTDRCRFFEHRISPGALSAMQIETVAGRAIEATDDADSRPVAVLSESAAKECWGTTDVVGKRFGRGYDATAGPLIEVVGVVEDVRHRGHDLRAHDPRDAYFPLQQVLSGRLSLLLQTESDPVALTGALRDAVARIDPAVPLYDVLPMSDRLAETTSESRFYAWFVGLCGLVALALAALGIYAVLAYTVNQRLFEMGLRQALGAQPFDLVRLVVMRAVRLVVVGLIVGLVLSWALSRVVAAAIYGVSATDPLTFAVTLVLLGLAGLAAAMLPALRASRVDPAVTLHAD